MEAVMREEGVLKLVHPGRYVEIHKEPITAAEVMKRNPRHCITMPEFFKSPWAVVRPEIVLLPGEVFFIVPSRTVYRLLKAHQQENHRNQQHNKIQKPPKTRNASVSDDTGGGDDQLPKKSLPRNSCIGMTPRHLLSNNSCLFPWKENNPRKHSQVKSWPPDVKKIKPQPQPSQEKKQQLLVDSKKKEKDQSTSSNEIKEILHRDHRLEAKRCNKQVTILKSGLRKPGDSSTDHPKRVIFLLPEEHYDKPARRIRESQEWPDHNLLNL